MGHFTRSLNHRQLETRTSSRSRSRGWKGQRTNNAPSRSFRRSGHPILASAAFRLRAFDRDLICGEHYGQRPWISAASTGRTHGSTDQLCITVQKSLANREPSTHGYKRKSGPCLRHVCLSPNNGHSASMTGYGPIWSDLGPGGDGAGHSRARAPLSAPAALAGPWHLGVLPAGKMAYFRLLGHNRSAR